MNKKRDYAYLQMAYGLAEKGLGLTSPNPRVGAVIVQNHNIVGFGYHKGPGKPHAEVNAIQMAGDKAKGGTAYITLEPCIHFGRTPPCTDSIIQSKLSRVVISALDPNPIIHKKGVEKLKLAGIEVSVGILKHKNTILNEAYNKYIKQNIPFITAKTATTFDGKMATSLLSSQWISSPAARKYMHFLRGENDAILVGINTILQDNPALTVRYPLNNSKKITRVILDSELRFPHNSKMLQTLPKGDIVIFCNETVSQEKTERLKTLGARIIRCQKRENGLNLNQVLQQLGKINITSMLVEGGSSVLTSFLKNNLLDKILISITPKLIGGKNAPSFFEGQGISDLKKSLLLKKTRSFALAEEVIMEGYF